MKRFGDSVLMLSNNGGVYHLNLHPEDIADTIILVGDPGRVELISSFFEKIEVKKSSREFNTCTGIYNGKRLTAISTGIGVDNIEIVIHELDALVNIDLATRTEKVQKRKLRIMRIGTSGGIQSDLPVGSPVFSTYSIGCDGILNWYKNSSSVRIKDMEDSFIEQLNWNESLARPYFVKASEAMIELFKDSTVDGMTITAPGFYAPQGRELRLPILYEDLVDKYENFRYKDLKITNFEMEGAAIIGLCSMLGHDSGVVGLTINNRRSNDVFLGYKEHMENLIRMVLNKLSE